MKKSAFFILFAIFFLNVSAQKHELRAGLNSGFTFFIGESSESSTFINAHGTPYVYANSPLGKKITPSFGIGANYRYVGRHNLIFGIELGYEDLRSKVKLTSFDGIKTKGRSIVNNHFLNAYPFIGYRFHIGTISLDATGGLDFAYSLDVTEKGKYKDENGKQIKYTRDRNDNYINFDIRPRIQVNANYRQYTLFAGGSIGLFNYYKDWIGGSPEAYLNAVRIGIQYRIF